MKIDALEVKPTTDPIVKQSPFVPRRPTPIGDLHILLDKSKKKNKLRESKHVLNLMLILLFCNILFCIANSTFARLFNELEGKVNEITPAASSKKRKRVHYSDESYMKIEGIDAAELIRLDRMTWEVNNANSNYEYVNDLHASMMEELDNAFIVMVEYQKRKDLYKQFLDAKYR